MHRAKIVKSNNVIMAIADKPLKLLSCCGAYKRCGAGGCVTDAELHKVCQQHRRNNEVVYIVALRTVFMHVGLSKGVLLQLSVLS